MCGIGAIINGKTEEIHKIMGPIKARGELDSFNENKIIGKTVLSCNRLRIVGRETGKQPIHNETKNVFAVLNGEIYNYEKLRQELKEKGHVFSTNTDTEVLVHAYEQWDKEFVKKLDGMFAFVIFDKKKNEFLAARDPYGIKPLFFAIEKDTTYFASEAKQLVKHCNLIKEVLPGTMIVNGDIKRYYELPEKDIDET